MSTATVSRVEIQALRQDAELLCPWWTECTPDEQALVLRDMDRACNGDGLEVDDYWADPMPKADHLASAVEQEQDAAEPPVPEPVSKRLMAHLERCVKLYGAGEHKYRDSLIKAGKEAHAYVEGKVTQGCTRKAVIAELEGALSGQAGKHVDVNRLIRVYWAVELLHGDDLRTLPYVPYRTLRDAFAQCVERDAKTNTYAVLPGKEAALRELFKHVADKRIDRDGAVALVNTQLGKAKADTATADRSDAPPMRAVVAPAEETVPCKASNPLRAMAGSNAKDVADSIGELFAEHDAPDDLLTELLRQVKARGICSAPVVRAIDAALTIIVRANAKEAA